MEPHGSWLCRKVLSAQNVKEEEGKRYSYMQLISVMYTSAIYYYYYY